MVDMGTYGGDGVEGGRKYLRSVIYFAITLLVVTILGAIFTNATIQSDFTAAAVASAGLITVILILGAIKFVEL